MGGGTRRDEGEPSRSPHVPSVDADEDQVTIDETIDETSVGSGVDPPELLPAHEIASEIAATPDSPQEPVTLDDEEPEGHSTPSVMIDASDFRGVLSEPTYQTLNGRMTPPGFPPSSSSSSSYATLTPLQPLPPISTMSDKFSHYGHHPGGGGFTLMQNVGMGNYHSYDKLGSAMAAAGMNMSLAVNSGNVVMGNVGSHQQMVSQHAAAAAAAAAMMSSVNGHPGQHASVNHGSGIPSPPSYHSNGLNSPDDKSSLSPTNGYDYSGGQRVLGSPHSPSSVNLHSPTSLMPALNGMGPSPATPPSAQMTPSPPDQITSSHSNNNSSLQQQIMSSSHSHPHLNYVSSHDTKPVISTTPHQVTVLQTVTQASSAIAPSAQTVTIVQAASAAVSNLTATIVSTPVAVVTTANALHQHLQHQHHQQQLQHQHHHHQQQQQQQHLQNHQNSNQQSNNSHSSHSKQATGASSSSSSSPNNNNNISSHNNNNSNVHSSSHNNNNNNSSSLKNNSPNNNCNITHSQASSDSSAASGDELEEINTKDLAQRISAELKRYSIPQAIFAQRVLCRSQGTLSDLLRNPKPWSKLKSGRETFRRMSKWLEEPEFQRMSALRLAG